MARSLVNDHQPYPVATSADLLALWRCDEASAAFDFADSGPNGYTVAQTANPQRQPSLFDSDDIGGARAFNGSTQWGIQAASPGIDATLLGDWSVMAWVVPLASPPATATILEYGIFGAGGADNALLRCEILSTGAMQVSWRFGGGGGTAVTRSTTAGDVTFPAVHHLAWVKEADPEAHDKVRVRFYVDGDLIATKSGISNASGGANGKWVIGGSLEHGSGAATPGHLWKGYLDDIVVLPFAATHERVRETYARGARDFSVSALAGSDALSLETHVRVLIQDRNGVVDGVTKVWDEYVDMSDVAGIDFVRSVEWGERLDDQGATATVTLMRQFHAWNLSPFVRPFPGVPVGFVETKNPFASVLATDVNGRYFLDARCRVKIEVALLPRGMGRDNVGPFWDLVFDGLITSADVSGTDVTVACADRMAALQDVDIETASDGTDRTYGPGVLLEEVLQDIIDESDPTLFSILRVDDSGAGGALQIDVLDTSVERGLGRPHLLQSGDSIKLAGTGVAAYDGVWTVDTVTDERITTLEVSGGAFAAATIGTLQALPALGYWTGKPALASTSSGFSVLLINMPATKNVGQALDDLATETIGWRVAYKYDENRGEFRLTLYDPTAETGAWPLVSYAILDWGRAATRIDDERNVGTVEYANDADKDSIGERKRYVVTAKNTAKGRQYGRRPFRIGVGGKSLITSAAEAQDLDDRAIADLADPSAEASWTTKLSYHPQISDLLTVVVSNDGQLPTVIDLASASATIVGLHHVYARGRIRTTFDLRKLEAAVSYSGRVGRIDRHFDLIQLAGSVGGRGMSPPASSPTPVAGLRPLISATAWYVSWDPPVGDGNRAYDMTEVHLSSAGPTFSPSSATLKNVMRGKAHLDPGDGLVGTTTYYVRLVQRDRMGNRGTASTAASFTTP